nr:NADH dehydrogenase subunit 5, mitochondrial [Tanacetum cinerariifolium]
MRLNAKTLICILLLIGATGKSAQIGSHTWSPDAMEGPTPVSALIHAATMVTAGVFMIARCSPLFKYPPTALIVITFARAMTSFLAATTGILQNDLKRVIAYSTYSQLGYMIFACGISNYSARIHRIFLDGYGVFVVRRVTFKISSFKLQNARLLLIFTKYSEQNMYLELVENVLEILHPVVELEVNFVAVEEVKIVLEKEMECHEMVVDVV